MINRTQKYAFQGGRIVLPEQVLDGTLLVCGEKIAGLLSAGAEIPAEYERVDVSGKVLMPGLIDTHVHMWDPSPLSSICLSAYRLWWTKPDFD